MQKFKWETNKMAEYIMYSPQFTIKRNIAGTGQGSLGLPVQANPKVARGTMGPP